jgi:hypothetical protein
MMPASADEIRSSPKAKSSQGTEVISAAATNSGTHDRRDGSAVRVTALITSMVTSPRARRLRATPAGVSASSPSLMK